MEKDDIRAAIGPLHLDARDAVAKGEDAARAFYRDRIMLEDLNRSEALIRHRILMRIAAPREKLAALPR
jgi:hypothetical protein